MKIGIAWFATDQLFSPAEMAAAVEERGFDALLLAEHTHIPATEATARVMRDLLGDPIPEKYLRTLDPFVALSYAAAATKDLRIGTGIALMAQRDPIVTAKAVASLDFLSGGRFLLGVGANWIPEEVANHDVVPERRWSVMVENVRAMREIWAHDVAEFSGEHASFGPIHSWPKPTQRPGPPVLIGGDGPATLRRLIEIGDEWLPHAGTPHDQLCTRIEDLRRAFGEARGGTYLPVTVYGASADEAELAGLAHAGVDRALIYAPSSDRSAVLSLLDQAAPMIERFAMREDSYRDSEFYHHRGPT